MRSRVKFTIMFHGSCILWSRCGRCGRRGGGVWVREKDGLRQRGWGLREGWRVAYQGGWRARRLNYPINYHGCFFTYFFTRAVSKYFFFVNNKQNTQVNYNNRHSIAKEKQPSFCSQAEGTINEVVDPMHGIPVPYCISYELRLSFSKVLPPP